MNVTPQSSYIHESGFVFLDRVLYEVKTVEVSSYVLLVDGMFYTVPKDVFVEIPDNVVLDPRSPFQKAYEDLKQRDVDYIKVYKERMGIHIFNSYAEEDYHRHKKGQPTPDIGLPEGHGLDERR